ncbi:MAG: signal recognition particle-docking protein FtsY [Candidatus Woesearchaeota archaeon]
MFEFLKKKLKGALSVFSKKVEEEVSEESTESAEEEFQLEVANREEKNRQPTTEKPKEESEKDKLEKAGITEEQEEPEKTEKSAPKEEKETQQSRGGILKKIFSRGKSREQPEILEERKSEQASEDKKEIEAEGIPEQKRGILTKISDAFTKKTISEEQFEKLFWDLEVSLLENNVAVEVIERIKSGLKGELVNKPLPRSQVEQTIENALKESIKSLFEVEGFDLVSKVREKKPYVILFLGINGSGKTTTIAKIANLLLKNGLSCVLAAGDTFRAAAIDQLEQHAQRLGVKLIKHQYGADSAAVAFDAIKYAEAHGINAVLIDTAGRMHSNTNLMDELKKIVRVAKPDLKIFVGEAITGNDCIEQARSFNEAVGIDAIILAKADIDEKGGTAISISYVTRKPILYLGTGQNYEDLDAFNPEKVVSSIGLA